MRIRGLRKFNQILHHLSKWHSASEPRECRPPCFIVGAPRTGSTILYQALTHNYRVGYIDNLTAQFYGDLTVGLRLGKVLFGRRGHGCFESIHGDTKAGGAHAPSECGSFWYRWLPIEDHYADETTLSAKEMKHLRAEIMRAASVSGDPLIFKNLNAGQRLRLLQHILPGMNIIWCRRDLSGTVRSIVNARTSLQWPANKIWSIRPQGWRDLTSLPVEQQVTRQVQLLEEQIQKDIVALPKEAVRVVEYHDLCKKPEQVLLSIAEWLDIKPRRPGDIEVNIDRKNSGSGVLLNNS